MQAAEKKNFDFVDTIRCIAMASIVYEHTCIFAPFIFTTFREKLIQTGIIQAGKFGTIIFFLISGFLINHKFNEYKPGQYLANRFRNTLKPWFIWLLIFFAVIMIDKLVIFIRFGQVDELNNLWVFVKERLYYVLFGTSFWFIPNFLIAISVLLIFRRYIKHLWFGLILLALSLFYSVNLYFGWIYTGHTLAVFGFVFYLWLGTQMNIHFHKVMLFIKNQSMFSLLAFTFVAYCIACIETLNLMRIGSNDAYNTLRFSNVVYSIFCFAVLLKIGSLQYIQKLKPRETTYGIYLIHQILIVFLLPMIFKPMHLEPYKAGLLSIDVLAILHFVRFLIVYSLSYLMALGLSRSKLKWTIGR